MGLPCHLVGTGMAFPWPLLRDAQLATADIVEDMRLGLDLALTGHAALLCLDARVTGVFPQSNEAAIKQRTRWEHGHLDTLIRRVCPLAYQSLRRFRPSLLVLAIDLAVPPLALLVLLQAAILAFAVAGVIVGAESPPVLIAVLGLVATSTAVILGWGGLCRDVVSAKDLLMAPLYVAWKIPLYLQFLRGRETNWVRTERKPALPRDATRDRVQPE
jgi:cellulose synthase/poly-beta-1,6-N-acetylglucosamine synthase-like glycosyltransferase